MASWARTGSFFTEKEVSEITFLPLHLQARGEASRLAHRRGGIVVGGGIFDLVLQLLSTPPASPPPSTPPGSSNVVPTHFNSPATLLIVPSADFAGWTSRIKGKSLAFLQAASKLSVEEFTAASLVVVSENVFSSKGYLDNLAKLSSSPSLNVKAENIKSGTLKEALKRLGELVGWLDSGKLLDGPPDLGEVSLTIVRLEGPMKERWSGDLTLHPLCSRRKLSWMRNGASLTTRSSRILCKRRRCCERYRGA